MKNFLVVFATLLIKLRIILPTVLIIYYLDSPAFTKLSSVMLKKSFVKGIKQASPLDQTSFLEGFHSVVNQFSPK